MPCLSLLSSLADLLSLKTTLALNLSPVSAYPQTTIGSLQCELLSEGCGVQKGIIFPEWVNIKRIHLYSHSEEETPIPIPDDIYIGQRSAAILCRIRYNSNSSKILSFIEGKYLLIDTKQGVSLPVGFIKEPSYVNTAINGYVMDSICSLLGDDLLGITPSNYCFYFKDDTQCRFCEILDTYKKSGVQRNI